MTGRRWPKIGEILSQYINFSLQMRIPTEQFARVPVVLLSPGLLLSPAETESSSGGSKNPWLRNTGAVGSAPASPASRRKDSALRSGTPASTPTMTPVSALTPTSTPPYHARRETEDQGLEKRSVKTLLRMYIAYLSRTSYETQSVIGDITGRNYST